MKKELIKIAEVTLTLLSKKSWSSLTLNEVKKKSQIKKFDNKIKKKNFLLKNINSYFDHVLSLKVTSIEKSTHKDMIFEILMIRFDILQNNRNAVLSIFQSFKDKPKEFILLLPSFLNSMFLMSNYANISVRGLIGQLRLKGLLIIYCSAFLIWIKDDTSSLEKTMMALDRYLDQANSILKYI